MAIFLRGFERWLPWLGGLLGLAALAWVLRGLDLDRFRAVIAGADLRFVLLIPGIVIAEQLVRAWKWRQLLFPLRLISSIYLFGAIMAGYLCATIIPFGFGTVARSWLVARREELNLPAVLATVALDRLSDGLVFVCLVPIAVVATAFPDPTGGVRSSVAWGGAGSLILFAGLLAGLELYRRQAANPGPIIGRMRGHLPTRLGDAIRRAAASFANGINWPRGWRGPSILLASVAIKILAATQFWAAGLAFGATLRPADYLFVMVFLGFLVIIGHFLRLAGGFVVGAVFVLSLFGVPEEEALAMSLVVQAANFLSVAGVGALALWLQGLALRDVRQAGTRDVPRDIAEP
jgi:glycosyltransferase 2 family protein